MMHHSPHDHVAAEPSNHTNAPQANPSEQPMGPVVELGASAGRLQELQATNADVRSTTEEVQEALAASEEHYPTLFDSIDEAVCLLELVYDEHGAVVDVRDHNTQRVFDQQTGIANAEGKRAHEVIPHLEPFWVETYATVARTGKPVRFEQYVQGTNQWFNVYASRVGGANSRFVAVVFDDITQRKRYEQHQILLRNIADGLVGLDDIGETMERLGATIGRYFQVQQCMFSELTDELETSVFSYGWHADNARSLTGKYRMRDFLSPEQLARNNAGELSVVCDTQTDGRVSAETYGVLHIRSFIIVPLARHRQWLFQLSIIDNKPRSWRADEITLVQELAARIWARLERARAEDALRQSEAKYRTLFETIDEGFAVMEVLLDERDHVVDMLYPEANAAFAVHSGFTDVVGKKASEFVPRLEHLWLDALTRVYRTGEPERIEGYNADLDRWFTLHYSRVGGHGSHFIAVVFNDITERKRVEALLRESEERQTFLLTLSDTLRAEHDEDAVVNRALQMLFEQMRLDRCYIAVYRLADDRGDITHQVGNDRVPPLPDGIRLSDFPAAFRVVFDQTLVIDDVAETEGLTDVDRGNIDALGMGALVAATVRKGVNAPLWVIVAVSATRRHWTQGEVALIEDVTERTWAAMERARAEAALAQSYTAERAARIDAEAALKTRDQFLSIASHELRTPLTSLLGYANMVQMPAMQNTEMVPRMAERISRQARRLNSLIEQLLDVSRLQQGQFALTPVPVELGAVVGEVVDEVRTTLPTTKHRIALNRPQDAVFVAGDVQRLEQVLYNLLTNAVKYSPDGGLVRVEVQCTTMEAVVEIVDQGIGIAEEAQARLFEPFYRAPTAGHQVSGFGLGLHIVREIVARHGGRIEVESAEGAGSTFRVALPLLEANMEQ